MYKKLLFLTATIIFSVNIYAQWKPAGNNIRTSWADNVTPQNVWQEYPRPTLQRAAWQNLNGLWNYAIQAQGLAEPAKYEGKILVPFPVESSLSGVRRKFDSKSELWYEREFTVPKNWSKSDIVLHFEAVDWSTKVYVNDNLVGAHKGGYDAFEFDITSSLKKGKNKLTVCVTDPSNDGQQASGKQSFGTFDDPEGAFYTCYSGIWQTVWMEPVSPTHIKALKVTPDVDGKAFGVNASVANDKNCELEVMVKENGAVIASQRGKTGKDVAVSLANPKLWTPDSPFLYDLEIKLYSDGKMVDDVTSYAGMRSITVEKFNEVPRICLNHQPIYEHGPLDQGYWPDGISTPPSDAAVKWEIQAIKDFGFNMIRKHMKVEPERWYYWCDKLGILVWQDMPCAAIGSVKVQGDENRKQFEWEMSQMVDEHWNDPSIVVWTAFNEHWGAYDVERIAGNLKKQDPSRLIMGNSGIDARRPTLDYECGDIKDNHSYLPPNLPLISSKRATVDGEYGALGYTIDGHDWSTNGKCFHNYYQDKPDKKAAATQQYIEFMNTIYDYIRRGLSATVYTQWTDVENEVNGLYTYDRKVMKLDKDSVSAANRKCYEINLK